MKTELVSQSTAGSMLCAHHDKLCILLAACAPMECAAFALRLNPVFRSPQQQLGPLWRRHGLRMLRLRLHAPLRADRLLGRDGDLANVAPRVEATLELSCQRGVSADGETDQESEHPVVRLVGLNERCGDHRRGLEKRSSA